MPEITVSVIMLSYNHLPYIRQAIESVLQQEKKWSLEFVICDDASTDGTADVIREYQKNNSEIVAVLREKNIGFIKNYYDAIKRVHGKYVLFCAADDFWLPGKLTRQVSHMEKHSDVSMCCHKVLNYSEKRKVFRWSMGRTPKVKLEDIIFHNKISAGSVCVRGDLLHQYDADVVPAEKNWLQEDYPLHMYMATHGKVHLINKFLSVYRIVPGSISHSNVPEIDYNLRKSTYEIAKYYAKNDEALGKLAYQCWIRNLAMMYLRRGELDNVRKYSKDLVKEKWIYYMTFLPRIKYILKRF